MSSWYVYTKEHNLNDSTIGSSNNTKSGSDACGVTSPPVIVGGAIYGTPNNPATGVQVYQRRYVQSQMGYSNDRTNSYRLSVTGGAPYFYYAASTATPTYDFRRNYAGNLIRTNNEISNATVLQMMTKVDASTVSGRYRPKQTNISAIAYGGVDIPVVYSYNGITYDHIVFPAWSTNYNGWNVSNTTSSGAAYMSTGSNRAAFAGYRESTFADPDFALTWFTGAYNSAVLSSDFQGKIIDFGDIPQEVPTFFVTWLNANYDQVYTNTYTIKNQGGETLAQITEAPAVKAAELLYTGTTATLNLTGVNDLVYTASWSVVTPAGKQFTGLKASNGVVIPLGTSTVSFIGATFTETFETYKPPATTFNINVYENTAEPNRVDKSSYLSTVTTLSGALREQTSIINPSIIIQRTTLPRFNYVYIPEFHRYYFVVNITAVRMKLWQIDLKCDPLMTYKTGIGALNAVVGRQENISNPDLTDTELPLEKENAITVQEITSNAFSTSATGQVYNYVLTVVGA